MQFADINIYNIYGEIRINTKKLNSFLTYIIGITLIAVSVIMIYFIYVQESNLLEKQFFKSRASMREDEIENAYVANFYASGLGEDIDIQIEAQKRVAKDPTKSIEDHILDIAQERAGNYFKDNYATKEGSVARYTAAIQNGQYVDQLEDLTYELWLADESLNQHDARTLAISQLAEGLYLSNDASEAEQWQHIA